MNARRGIVSALILAGTLAASTAVGTDVQAVGHRDSKLNKVVVRFGDLDIRTEKGVETLLRRLKRAAKRVCGGYSGTPRAYANRSRLSYRKCVDQANTNAVNALIAKLGKRADTALNEGDLDAADKFYRRVLALNTELERKAEMIASLDKLGKIAVQRGDLEGAESFYQRSFALNRDLGRKVEMAVNLDIRGELARQRGNLDTAEYCHRRALALNAELNRKAGIANQLAKLGVVAWTRGDFDTAATFHRSAYALHKEMDNRESMAGSLSHLGSVARSRGDLEAAESFHRRALALNMELGRKEAMSAQLSTLWSMALEQNRLDDAEAYLSNALRVNRELGAVGEIPAVGQTQMGLIRYVRGDTKTACVAWTRAQAMYRESGNQAEAFRVGRIMSDSGCDAVRQHPVTAALNCQDGNASSCFKALPLPKLKPRRKLSNRSRPDRPVIASTNKVR